MSVINTTVVGNLTGDVELKFTNSGTPVAAFTIAVNERIRDKAGQWQDGPTSFVRCNAWRQLAEHLAESMSKGDRLMAVGTFRQRDYTTKEGEKRSVWELAVSAAGPDLSYATAKIARAERTNGNGHDRAAAPADDPWAGAGQPDEPPF